MTNTPHISLVIATFHGQEYISELFASLAAQTLLPRELIIIDNSTDSATVAAIEQQQTVLPFPLRVYPQDHNLDFAAGYNLGMRHAHSEYICILNQDMVLAPDALEQLYHALQRDERLAVVGPKLLRYSTESSHTIDSMGLSAHRHRRYTNVGEGETDAGQYDVAAPGFGVSGAAMLFRHVALEDVAVYSGATPLEYFDELFVSYKEDIDLCYRLLHRGWRLAIAPQSIIYHKRTARELKSTEGVRADCRQKSLRVRAHSWRNHLWLLLKNEPSANLLRDALPIMRYELQKIAYIIVQEPSTLRAVPSLLRGLPAMWRKRKIILRHSLLTPSQLRQRVVKP